MRGCVGKYSFHLQAPSIHQAIIYLSPFLLICYEQISIGLKKKLVYETLSYILKLIFCFFTTSRVLLQNLFYTFYIINWDRNKGFKRNISWIKRSKKSTKEKISGGSGPENISHVQRPILPSDATKELSKSFINIGNIYCHWLHTVKTISAEKVCTPRWSSGGEMNHLFRCLWKFLLLLCPRMFYIHQRKKKERKLCWINWQQSSSGNVVFSS